MSYIDRHTQLRKYYLQVRNYIKLSFKLSSHKKDFFSVCILNYFPSSFHRIYWVTKTNLFFKFLPLPPTSPPTKFLIHFFSYFTHLLSFTFLHFFSCLLFLLCFSSPILPYLFCPFFSFPLTLCFVFDLFLAFFSPFPFLSDLLVLFLLSFFIFFPLFQKFLKLISLSLSHSSDINFLTFLFCFFFIIKFS